MSRIDAATGGTTAASAERLQRLQTSFTAFRRGRRPGQWVPRALRAQVVSALDEGVPLSLLREACGVSSAQLGRWRAAAAENVALAQQREPRVLSFVDAEKSAPAAADETIELRIGPWQVLVRRAAD